MEYARTATNARQHWLMRHDERDYWVVRDETRALLDRTYSEVHWCCI